MVWWKKTELHFNIVTDIDAIIECLQGLKDDVKKLLPELEKLQELVKEREVAAGGLIQVNLKTQAKVLDSILQQYEFFENDIDINGLRLKQIAQQFLQHAEKAGLKDLVKEKKQQAQWKMLW